MTIQGADLVAVFSGGLLEHVAVPTAPVGAATSTVLDDELLEAVYDIIDEFGKIVTFWIYPDQDYDPTIGENTLGDPTQYSKKVIPPYQINLKYVDGKLIKLGDLLTGIAAQDIEFTPTLKMKITIDSNIWTIININPIYSGEQIALYLLQLRK